MKIFRISVLAKMTSISIIAMTMMSCQKEFEFVSTIYQNDFEEGDSWDGLFNSQVIEFNNTRMLGNYHDGWIQLHLTDLPTHSILRFEFDLYILDSWDGNNTGNNGPDRWFMEVKKEWEYEQNSIEDWKYVTTFSNAGDPSRGLCFQELGCVPQSYPDRYPSFNFPRTGADQEMNGRCLQDDRPNGAMLYRFSQTILHDYSELHLFIYDSLVQDNAFSEPCDESWALDNLRITAFNEI